MPNDDGFYGLTQYSPVWLLLGLGIVALVIVWYVVIWWYSKRKHRPTDAQKPRDYTAQADELRAKYLGLIDEVESAFENEELSRRGAHQKLGTLVRFFVYESSGVPAQVMTLDDLSKVNLRTVSEAVESYYPAEFAEIEQGNVSHSAQLARQVVGTWR